jgi:hypothetical protein
MQNSEQAPDIQTRPSDLSRQFPFTVFYQGNYENAPSHSLIDVVKKNLDLIQEKNTVKPLLYLLIETLQNIERYSTHKISSEDCALVYMDKHNFYSYTQNLVDNGKVPALRERLVFLEGKSREDLDKLYKEVMAAEELTERGAGLGLIDLARKTQNRMFYEIKPFDKENSVYSICYAMPINKSDISQLPDFEASRMVFEMLKRNFGKNRSTLFYSGDFSNKFVHSLLDFLKKSKVESEGSKNSKLHYILIELTQNIRRHSLKVNGISQGQLSIEWNEKGISISTSNPVQEPNGTRLVDKIAKINACTPAELKEYHQATLTDFTTESGIGLIDVAALIGDEKMKCGISKKPNFSDELNISLTYKNE